MQPIGLRFTACALFILSALAASLGAQDKPASVTGVILGKSEKPVAGARVALLPSQPTGPVTPQQTTTGEDGRFTFTGMNAGTYRVITGAPGYLPPEQPVTVTLEPGQSVTNFVIRLAQAGAIRGKVVDEDGDPMYNARAFAMRVVYNRGKRIPLIFGNGITNEQGEFTIPNLRPGRYIIRTITLNTWTADELAPLPSLKPGELDMRYGNTFFPSVHDPSAAVPIDVGAGEEPYIGTVNMRRIPFFHIRGKVIGDPALLRGARIVFIPKDPSAAQPWSAGAIINPDDGTFDMAGMRADDYTLAISNRTSILGYLTAVVVDRDLKDVVMMAASGTLTGTVRVEGEMPENSRLRVQTIAADTGSLIQRVANVENGQFRIENPAPGRHWVKVLGAPPGAYLKSVRSGGQDAVDTGLSISSGTAPVEIVISTKGATIQGAVHTRDGEATPKAVVTLVPETPISGDAGRHLTTIADAQGVYTLKGVAPGRYRLFAWEEIESTAHWDPEFIALFASQGQRVAIEKEGETVSVALTRIAAAAMHDTLMKNGR